jgi:hypothetical protein
LFALTFANWSPVLLPLSIFNSIAIVFLITALMTLVLTLITRRAGKFTNPRMTIGYFCGGFILAAVFIAVLATTRLTLFGPGPLG